MADLSALGWLARMRPQGLGDLAQIDPVTGQPVADAQMGNAVSAPVLSGLLRGAWGAVDYPRQVLQGEAQVIDPATGHVTAPAVNWALEQAAGRMPAGFARPMKLRAGQVQRMAFSTDPDQL